MPHLRVGIVGDVRPSTALLVGLMLSKQRLDDVFIIVRSEEHVPLNKDVIALELIRVDIPAIESRALTRERMAVPDVSLEEVLMLEKSAEEFILPEREPLPRPPKSIRPKASPRPRPIMRKGALRSR